VRGKGTFLCSVKNIPLVPKTYVASVRITANGELLDYIQSLVPIEILDGDFFGTGSSIRHSLVYMPHVWKNKDRENRAS
jgi:hypothetical protein